MNTDSRIGVDKFPTNDRYGPSRMDELFKVVERGGGWVARHSLFALLEGSIPHCEDMNGLYQLSALWGNWK